MQLWHNMVYNIIDMLNMYNFIVYMYAFISCQFCSLCVYAVCFIICVGMLHIYVYCGMYKIQKNRH